MDTHHQTEDSLNSAAGGTANPETNQTAPAKRKGVAHLWEGLIRIGLGESALRIGTGLLSIVFILAVIWVMRTFYLSADKQAIAVSAADSPTSTPSLQLPSFDLSAAASLTSGIGRLAEIHTTLPSRPRFEVVAYTVVAGDTIFGIAEKFGLSPKSILWGNRETLGDNPEWIQPGMALNILPVDGVYHQWSAGEGLNGIAEYYGVSVDTIIDWPSNRLSRESLGDLSNPKIEPGTMLVIPGGEREFTSWTTPQISRSEPAKAKILGPGYCDGVYSGAVGTGTFVYPTGAHFLSGYDYSPDTNHRGLDFDGDLGSAIFASDTGVVVYAGWNNYGYGNVVVLDHGNGWQTLYAHLDSWYVSCGEGVYQGATIGLMGSTGNSTGPHLHYELSSDTLGKVNPWDYLQ